MLLDGAKLADHMTGKKKSQLDDSLLEEQEDGEESEEEQDSTRGELSYETLGGDQSVLASNNEDAHMLPEQQDRRATFTFSVHPEVMEEMPEHELHVGSADDVEEQPEVDAPMEDATITRLFRSPAKDDSTPLEDVSQPLQYPELPQSVSDEVETDVPILSFVQGQYVAIQEVTEIEAEAQNSHLDSAETEESETTEDVATATLRQQGTATIQTDAEGISEIDASLELAPSGILSATEPAPSDVAYPTLPMESSQDEVVDQTASSCRTNSVELVESEVPTSNEVQEVVADPERTDHIDIDMEDELAGDAAPGTSADEEFTEASLQLDIQNNYGTEQPDQPATAPATAEQCVIGATDDHEGPMEITEELSIADVPSAEDNEDVITAAPSRQIEDITDGLTLSFTPARATSNEPTPRKLHSPPPPPTQSTYDDATMTIALDDDTALLKDFLNRAAASKAASKAEKAAVLTHRRESLQNRRDSDVIRHALASPRKVLEDKDPNSPSKYDNELTLDLSQNLTLTMDTTALVSPTTNEADDGDADDKASRGSRRSSRTKKSRLPAPASATQAPVQASKIAIRRADGTEHVVLKKSDAQELSLLTRANTRKNKQGAFGVTVRLAKLTADASNLPPVDDATREIVIGKNIRWDEQLTYYQENPETVAERESLATPDELSMPDAPTTTTPKPKIKSSKNSTSTPKMRRVRGLGTANGTPGKALLAPPSFGDSFDDEKEKEKDQPPQSLTQQVPRPRASKLKKMTVASSTPTQAPADSKLPALEVMPVGIETPKERKSRLAAPKKVVLPPSAVAVEGKENATTQRTGLGNATPKKGIPAPKVVVPHSVGGGASAGVESGLPRRRGRRVL